MKKLLVAILLFALSQSVFAGEVTGAGLVRMLKAHQIDTSNFSQLGLDVVVKKAMRGQLPLGNIKYYIGADSVFPAQRMNRVEFKPNRRNNFLWQNVESFEVGNMMVFPSDIQGFVIQKKRP